MKSPVSRSKSSGFTDFCFIGCRYFAELLKLLSFLFLIVFCFRQESGGGKLPDTMPPQPFIDVEVPAVYDMGVINNPGIDWWDAEKKLELLISTNLYHDGISLRMSDLKHVQSDSAIGAERIYVRQLHNGTYQPMNNLVAVTDVLGPGTSRYLLDFRVRPSVHFTPGRYRGVLVITVIGP